MARRGRKPITLDSAKKAAFKENLRQTGGVVTRAAELFGVSSRTAIRLIESDPELRKLVDNLRAKNKPKQTYHGTRSRFKKCTNREIIDAFEECEGVVKRASSVLGVTAKVLHSWIAKDPSLQAALADVRSRNRPPGTGRRKYDPKVIADALRKTKGMVSQAAKMVGCSHTTILQYRHDFPEVEEAVQEARTELVDIAELQLRRKVVHGETRSTLFTLQTLGKDRGFVVGASSNIGDQSYDGETGVMLVPVLGEKVDWERMVAGLGLLMPGQDPEDDDAE